MSQKIFINITAHEHWVLKQGRLHKSSNQKKVDLEVGGDKAACFKQRLNCRLH